MAVANDIVIALARAAAPPEGSEALGEEALDSLPCPNRVPIPVLPVDSSQLKALTVARAGRHVVVHGPPGTGKSQTISNLIADALGENKKVLFVSAKMAALNVVHDRLAQLGLGDFCLEAHSTKAGKATIIEDLKRTLGAAQDAGEDRLDEHLDDFLRIRDQLNETVRELHRRREPLGLSAYQAIGRVERLRSEPEIRGPLPWDDPLKASRADLKEVVEALAELGSQAEVFDRRASHPWRGLAVLRETPVRREAIEATLMTVRDKGRALQTDLAGLAPLLGSSAPQLTFDAAMRLAGALADLAALDSLPHYWPARERDEMLATAMALDAAAADTAELKSRQADHDRALRIPVGEALRLLEPADTQLQSWTRVWMPSYWWWHRSIGRHLAQGAARDAAALRTYLTVGRRIRELEESFGGRQEFLCREVGVACARDAEALAVGAQRLRVAASVRKVIAECGLTASSAPDSLADDMRSHITSIASVARDDTLKGVIALLDEAWPGGFVDGVTVTDAPLSALLARCEEALAALPRLQEWMALQHCLRRCRELGAMGFIEALGPVTARAARGAFERRFYTAWANAALEVSPALAVFAGSRLEQQIARFRVLDGELRNAALSRTRATARTPARRVASAQGGVGRASEVGILRRELEKRKRIKPLRRLFAEIPTVLQALKPCMLMSPLSVSTFLKPGAVTFDLVIFDEASQLPTPEGIPAILRAKQVVVAGDSKQLPPTSFFTASIIGDDDGAEGNNGEELEPTRVAPRRLRRDLPGV